MKQHYELLIADMTTKHKSAMEGVDSKQGVKIAYAVVDYLLN